MRTSISENIIKPQDCALAFGIPTSEEDFVTDQSLVNKDFAKKFNGIRKRYVAEFLNPLGKTEPRMAQQGAKIVHRLRLDDFEALFHDDRSAVVIVFSHWKNDSVEFFDGLATVGQIITRIPAEFVGIIDWCVCWPDRLIERLREERPKCLFRSAQTKTTPFFWLRFYLALFELLASNELSYLDALEKLVVTFFKIADSSRRLSHEVDKIGT